MLESKMTIMSRVRQTEKDLSTPLRIKPGWEVKKKQKRCISAL